MKTTKLPVNEVFESIQGEATFTGTPSVFIRLHGCPVGCHWCDTKHTWTMTNKVIPINNMLEKVKDADNYSMMSVRDILLMLKDYKARHIVLTGGEPALYDLNKLTNALTDARYSVQLETSGTHEIKVNSRTFVTVSPKIDMKGGFPILSDCVARADEIKYPVGKLADIDKLFTLLIDKPIHTKNIWLQPLSQNKNSTALCIEQATIHNYKISIQTHKFIGVR